MEENTKKVYLFLMATAVLWGANPIAVKSVLGEMTPTMIVLVRFLGISLILLAVTMVKEKKNAFPPKQHILALILMGLTGVGINNGLQFTGLQYSTAINCVLVSALTPALTAFMAGMFLNERLQARQWIGVLLSLSGVAFLVTHGSVEMIRQLAFNKGDLLFLSGQLGWAIYTLLSRKVLKDMSPMATTAWSGLAGAVFMGVAALLEGQSGVHSLSYFGWLSMLYMIAGSGILAFNWWNVGVAAVGPNRASIFLNVIPLAGILLSVIFLHEHIGWRECIGGVCILLGVYLTVQKMGDSEAQAA